MLKIPNTISITSAGITSYCSPLSMFHEDGEPRKEIELGIMSISYAT